MNKLIYVLAAGVLAMAWPAAAQDEDMGEEVPREPWRFTIAGIYQDTSYARNALQTRADDDEDSPWTYDEGDSDGDGDGFRLALSRGRERLTLTYVDTDYEFTNFIPEGPTSRRFAGTHTVLTDRKDFELAFSRTMDPGLGVTPNGNWGWQIAVRRIDTDNEITIEEQARDRRATRSVSGDITWQMLSAGYFGVWLPFAQPYVKVYGSINLLFGEADGLAREGNDEALNGSISEQYKDASSLAYGANAAAGIAVSLYKEYVGLGAEYSREWMYSFEATDSGTVVFPDNNDALFIESQHILRGYAYVSIPF